ncbi:amidase [Falsiroseomonas sp.]|uniref:amidase n=1 Tax=Falsiroseomonas sp. TaxID=2870721 RepID=UPI003F713C5B
MTQDLALMPAGDLVALYRTGHASPVEHLRAVLAQVAALNPVLNAFCWLDEDSALRDARASEARWKAGAPASALDGVTATVKDLSVTRGWPTRRASRAIPAEGPWLEDSPSVARMREAGAVLIGKTTVPEFGAAYVTKSELCGISRNPWNPAMTPGGSSGGSAASVAAGMGTIALASDAAGSIRAPASMSGVFGLKTSFGRVADYPSSYLGTLAVIGPITRTVREAALCMDVISQPDARDSYALPPPGHSFLDDIEGGVKGLRIAYSPTLGFAKVDPEVAAIVAAGVKALEAMGAIVEIVDHVMDDPSAMLGTLMAPGLANAFRIFGFTEAQQALMLPRLVETAARGAAVPMMAYLAAREAREKLGARMRAFHERYDLLVTPVGAIPGCDADADAPRDPRYAAFANPLPFGAAFNLTKQPAASVPVGVTASGLPVGMQVVGPLYADALVLRACLAIEQALPMPAPDLAALRHSPFAEAIPRGLLSQREAMAVPA